MRAEFAGRSVVFLTAMAPNRFSLKALEDSVPAGSPRTSVMTPELLLAEYEGFQILLPPDGRLQLNLALSADADFCAQVTRAAYEQVVSAALRGVGFNGTVKVTTESETEVPGASLLDLAEASRRVGEDISRVGFKLVYASGPARTTVSAEPAQDDVGVWLASVNRHYDAPIADQDFTAAVDWLGQLDEDFVDLSLRLLDPNRNGVEHAA